MSGDGEHQLFLLQAELAQRGMKADLDTRPAFPRLRVHSHLETSPDVAEFENSVVAAHFGHDLWFAWPWAEPICRVSDVAAAADHIVEALSADDGGGTAPPPGRATA
jgi:hypothetical protein